MLKSLFILFIGYSVLTYQTSIAADKPEASQPFVTQGLTLKLHTQSSWFDLMHYRPNLFSTGVTSQADSRNYFLDKDGKTNPKTEFIATIRALFFPVLLKSPDQHAQCLFVARRNWLIEKLPGLESALPTVECREFTSWFNSINPNSITLSFPAAYINNPGSMFGHTLLRIDPPQNNEHTSLTSYAITYAANTDETNGFAFAIKGMMGGYAGLFTVIPYYQKLNEYLELENRDIWEYSLNLTPKESKRLVEHMWELQNTIFDYYFLDENCSYQLLALLDVARPGLNIAAEFPLEVVPADTVRIIQQRNMVKKTIYRPAILTNLQYQLQHYSGTDLDMILSFVNGSKTPTHSDFINLPEQQKILILEIAYNYLQFKFKANEIARPQYAKRSLSMLKARNKLDPDYRIPEAPQPTIRPEQGHHSSRLVYSLGTDSNSDYFELNWRPSYHDLLDNQSGFVDGLQINFLDVFARFNTASNKIVFERIDLVNLYSLKSRNQYFKPFSWKFNMSFRRKPLLYDSKTRVFNLNGGGGVSYNLSDSVYVYGLLETTVLLHRRLPDSVSFALGPNLGVLWQASENWKIWLDSSTQFYDKNNNINYQTFELAQSYSFNNNYAMRLHWIKEGLTDKLNDEIKLSLHWYY